MAIDLNADLGEDDVRGPDTVTAQLMDIVSSTTIACGGHVGDADSMQYACALAAERGVAIGAHVSYQDREGFGRRPINVPLDQLVTQVRAQIEVLDTIALAAGSAVTYVKAHGALYHQASVDPSTAAAVVQAIEAFRDMTARSLAVLSLPGSALVQAAEAADIRAFGEAFADRVYLPDGRPLQRGEPGATITDSADVVARLERLLHDEQVTATDGSTIEVRARSLGLPSDGPGAVVLARRLRSLVLAERIRIAPFAPPPERSSQPTGGS